MSTGHIHFGNAAFIEDPELAKLAAQQAVSAFLDELTSCLEDERRSHPGVLRFDTQLEHVNDGCVQATVIAGFLEGESLRELKVACERIYSGGEESETPIANFVYGTLKDFASRHNLRFAGGQYVTP